VIDSNQYGTAAEVAATTAGATSIVEDVFKAAEALPVGPAYVTAGAKDSVKEETTEDTCGIETCDGDAATRLIAPSKKTTSSSILTD
jgi:hypothetical protein